MAQQASNAQQREPSMEEILASIRRIIEDNEPPHGDLEIEQGDAAIGPAANDPAPSQVLEKSSPETAAVVAPTVWPDKEAEQPEALTKALPETSVAGRLETPVRPSSTAVSKPAASTAIDDMPPRPTETALLREGERAPRQTIDVAALSAGVAEDARRLAEPQWDAAFLKSLDERVEADGVATGAEVKATPSAQVAPVSAGTAPSLKTEAKAAIISPHAGRQVAASFGDLSEAFASSRRRSFDEMAEDMMRPLLQDWLDNNLPVLVERLVREEIERVARGG